MRPTFVRAILPTPAAYIRNRPVYQDKLRACLSGEFGICLDIPDDYEYMQPELVELLEQKVGRILGSC